MEKIDKTQANNQILYNACRFGYRDIVYSIIEKVEQAERTSVGLPHERSVPDKIGVLGSERSESPKFDWNAGLNCACCGGYMDLVLLMLEKGATGFNNGLVRACQNGHKEIANLLIEKGANDWDNGLTSSCYGGYKELVFLIIEKGEQAKHKLNWNQGLVNTCSGGHKELALLIISKGANNFSKALTYACEAGHVELAKLMISKGINNLYQYLRYNNRYNIEINLMLICSVGSVDYYGKQLSHSHIYYLVQKGVTDFTYVHYYKVVRQFEESQKTLTMILTSIINNDLISEILTY